ncbi:tRNA-specific adenosine deaminase 1 [Aplochiton taeniatus]
MWTADEIAKLCYNRFHELPKRGKPEPGREWTLLAGVVKVSLSANNVEKEVVSLGIGTKCIGRNAMSSNGDVLNDSHAEVIARRGCIRYLTEQLRMAVSGQESSVFCQADQRGKWKLQPGVSFLFFSSHTPCGDASIIPMTDSQSQPCPPIGSEEILKSTYKGADWGGTLKRGAEENSTRANKIPRLEQREEDEEGPCVATTTPAPDIHRTGAKCVPGGPADALRPGAEYHSVGVLRVKPGRGEPTLSLSCSDKLARWGVLGFQGALLSHYLEGALYFRAVVVGKCPYSQEAMERAVITRCARVAGLPAGYSATPPELLQSSEEFPCSQAQTELQHRPGQGRVSPCGAAISWCNVLDQPVDVTANGYKHGVTKKALGTTKSRSLLCKVELFHGFLSVMAATDQSELPDSLRGKELQTYRDYKRAARSYQQAWQEVRSQAFPLWEQSDRSLLLFQ